MEGVRVTDLAKAARAASRAIAKMNGNGRREGSDQRGMAWGDVVAVHNQFVDVMTGGTVSGSLRYTTACDGIAEGDRVLIQHVGREPVVVGIVSKGEKKSEATVHIGTTILQSNADRGNVLFSSPGNFDDSFGVGFDINKDYIFMYNGDGNAVGTNIISPEIRWKDDVLEIVARTSNSISSGQLFRVNWMVYIGPRDSDAES